MIARLLRKATHAWRLHKADENVAWFERELAAVQRDLDAAHVRYAAVAAEEVNVDYPAPRGVERWTA